MKNLVGVSIILAFLVIGELLATLIGHLMPGSVLGMILMFLSLCAGVVKPEWIRKPAEFLTNNMTIFFLPAAIGIMEEWDIIKSSIVPWVIILFVCWLLVLASVGWTEQLLSKVKRK